MRNDKKRRQRTSLFVLTMVLCIVFSTTAYATEPEVKQAELNISSMENNEKDILIPREETEEGIAEIAEDTISNTTEKKENTVISDYNSFLSGLKIL